MKFNDSIKLFAVLTVIVHAYNEVKEVGLMTEVYGVALIPLIMGLVELLKWFGLPKKLLPIVSIFLGLAAGIIYVSPQDIKGGILVGLMMGLSASGLYSGTKTTFERNNS